MAIIKFNNRRNSTIKKRNNRLRRAIDYITDLNKTCHDLIGGNSVNENNAFERMKIVKEYYNKCGGREYIHFVVSFKGKQNADIAYEIADNISMIFENYQVIFAVHLNTSNTHIHFVINTVCVLDGHKYGQSKSDMQNLKQFIENIITQSGIMYDGIYEEGLYSDYCYELDDDLYELDLPEEESQLIEPFISNDDPDLIDPFIFY